VTFDVVAVMAYSVCDPAPVVGISCVVPAATEMPVVAPDVVTVLPPK
jgi:hypothetical protein